MNVTTETMSLTCGDSMLEGMSGGMSPGDMMPDGLMGGDAVFSLMQNAMGGIGQMMQSGMMDAGMMGGGMGPWMLLGWIVPLLVLIGLGALAVWAIRTLAGNSGGSGGGHSANDALEVARDRYARGEIDREEFRAIRSDLVSD